MKYKFYKSLNDEYDISQRANNRFLGLSKELAKVLWKRTNEFLPKTGKPFGFGVDGVWKASFINECFRFSEYIAPNIGFKLHRDASYIKNHENRSIYTILLYLNDNYEGGHTNIYETPKGRKIGMTVAEETNGKQLKIIHNNIPKSGSMLIFNHDTIHEGSKVTKGIKYIIRTDLVFERINVPKDYIERYWFSDPMFIKAVNLYREANNKETNGDIVEAGLLYEKGLAIRQFH